MSLRQGERWEAFARAYLERRGLEVLKSRYRCRLGELDLVCRDGREIVIVEVRARAAGSMVPAAHSIGEHKRRRIVLATRHLLMRHAQWARAPLRFDVVAIDAIDTAEPKVDWIKHAFDAG
ncbi:MAG TPA: YraN family protein [Gammaproteobacteria bacterium]